MAVKAVACVAQNFSDEFISVVLRCISCVYCVRCFWQCTYLSSDTQELLSELTNLVFSQKEAGDNRRQETTGYQETRNNSRDSFFYDDVDNYDELP